MGLNLDEQKAVDRFRKDVVEPSMKKLVILDFWAEWCGPCKALAPVLEKVSAEYADKGVVLAKIDVDKEQFIAAQFQIPIVHRPPLARVMYDEVETGQYIPERFYQAIAEILAYVYQLGGKSPAGLETAGAPA